jgi:hypothetical protein
MQAKLLMLLIQILMSVLTPKLIRRFADIVLDFAEDFVIGTKSTVDDRLVLPICEQIRIAFDIPDEDE